MGNKTHIEWCDATFNPWWGCTKVTPGCKHCYAEALSTRFGQGSWGPDAGRHFTKSWPALATLNGQAIRRGKRQRVFVGSMCDLFERHQHPDTNNDMDAARFKLWDAVRHYAGLIFILLTKRPENVRHMVPEVWMEDGWPSNVCLMFSAESQQAFDSRMAIVAQLSTDTHIRYLGCSMEPLLEPVAIYVNSPNASKLDWLIVGGESGPGARPMHWLWADSLRSQVNSYEDTKFFFKQWGTWVPQTEYILRATPTPQTTTSLVAWAGYLGNNQDSLYPNNVETVYLVGKQQAPRTLNGELYNQHPFDLAIPLGATP